MLMSRLMVPQGQEGEAMSTVMSQGLVYPPFVTRTHSEPSYPVDAVFGKDRLGLRHALLTQQHLDGGGSESVSPFGGDSARGDTSARCTECSSQADPADLSGGLHSPLDQTSPQSSGRSMNDVFSDHPAVPSGRHMPDPQHMFGLGGAHDGSGLPTFEEIQRRLSVAMGSSAALLGGGPHPSAPPVMRHASTDGGACGCGAAARHRRSHSADGRDVGKRLRVISHDLDLSAVAAESRALYAPSDELDLAAAFGSLQMSSGYMDGAAPMRGGPYARQLPTQFQRLPEPSPLMPEAHWSPPLQVAHTSSSPGALEMEQLLQAAAEQGAANAEAKLAQQWQALVAGLDPQSLAQYLHNMQLLSTDAALDSPGVSAGGWPLQCDAGGVASPSLAPYPAQAAARQQLAAMAAGRLDGTLGGSHVLGRVGSPFGPLEPALQPQFVGQPRQLARLKGLGPGVPWMAAPDLGSSAGRVTPSFESPRSVDSVPTTPGSNQVRRCFSGGHATSSFPTPTFPTPGARFSPQPSPRGGGSGHRLPTASLHPSPLAPSSASGSGLETPLPQSTGTGFFCPAVSATAPRARGGRSNRQRQRDTPPLTTAEAGKTEASGSRRRRGSRRSLESDLSRSAADATPGAADITEPQPV